LKIAPAPFVSASNACAPSALSDSVAQSVDHYDQIEQHSVSASARIATFTGPLVS